MELVNHSAAAAILRVGNPTGSRRARLVLLVAKLTYSARAGRTELETQDVLPVFEEDVDTALGVLPSDIAPSYPKGFEVLLLGAAYSQGGAAATTVELDVSGARARMDVFGDRRWVEAGGAWGISEPAPFERMPLSWDRAFGGSCTVWMDNHTRLDVRDSRNPRGRGFDPRPPATELAAQWGAPESYPRYQESFALPNLEDPTARIVARADAPRPACWAPIPVESTLRAEPLAQLARPANDGVAIDDPGGTAAKTALFWRAAPELRFGGSPLGLPITARGVTPTHSPWSVVVPRVGVMADFRVGEQSGTKPLRAHRVLLLPEEERFSVTFARRLAFGAGDADQERSIRLRIEEGAA